MLEICQRYYIGSLFLLTNTRITKKNSVLWCSCIIRFLRLCFENLLFCFFFALHKSRSYTEMLSVAFANTWVCLCGINLLSPPPPPLNLLVNVNHGCYFFIYPQHHDSVPSTSSGSLNCSTQPSGKLICHGWASHLACHWPALAEQLPSGNRMKVATTSCFGGSNKHLRALRVCMVCSNAWVSLYFVTYT